MIQFVYIFFFVIALTTGGFSQEAEEALPDTVFTSEQILRISFVIDSLKQRVSYLEKQNEINEQLISKYKDSKLEFNNLLENYERYSLIQEAQLTLLDKNIGRYQEMINNQKRPFWDKPVIWAILGGTTMYISSKIVANVK